MKYLFADTSFYVAIFSPQDALHAKAKALAAAHQRLRASPSRPAERWR